MIDLSDASSSAMLSTQIQKSVNILQVILTFYGDQWRT